MSASMLDIAPPSDGPDAAVDSDEPIRSPVRALLYAAFANWSGTERRYDQRCPYPHLINLTPVAKDGITPIGETIVVVGKHLSERGLDFFHGELLPYRRMIASLEIHGGGQLSLLMELTWCRFCRNGWYDNGGRFLKKANPPSAIHQNAE